MSNHIKKNGLIISMGNPFKRHVRNSRIRSFSEIFNYFNISCDVLSLSQDSKEVYILEDFSHLENVNGSSNYKKKITFQITSKNRNNKYNDFFNKFNLNKYDYFIYLPMFRFFTYKILNNINKDKIIIYDFFEIQSFSISNIKSFLNFLSWILEVLILMKRSNYVLSISIFNNFISRIFFKKTIKMPLLIPKNDLLYKNNNNKNRDNGVIKILVLGSKKEDGLERVFKIAKEFTNSKIIFFFSEKFIEEKNNIESCKNIKKLKYIKDDEYYTQINQYNIILLARPLSFKNLGNFPMRFIDALRTNIIIITGETGLIKNYICENAGIFSCKNGNTKNIIMSLHKAINFYKNNNKFKNLNIKRNQIIKKLKFTESNTLIEFFSKIFKL